MTAVSEAMPVYAPEMDAEAFVSVPERLQQPVSYTHLTLPTILRV